MKPPSPLENDDDVIATLRDVEVPEPSPLFWDHLSKRVHDAVAAEPVPSPTWTSRFNFAWAGGIVAVLAIVVFAFPPSGRRQPTAVGPAAVAAPSLADAADVSNVLPALEDDASWAVMGDLASEMDFEQAGAAGLTVTPGAADGALTQLSGDEQRVVVELLQEEIKNSKSL
jgi:hypothetical protein